MGKTFHFVSNFIRHVFRNMIVKCFRFKEDENWSFLGIKVKTSFNAAELKIQNILNQSIECHNNLELPAWFENRFPRGFSKLIDAYTYFKNDEGQFRIVNKEISIKCKMKSTKSLHLQCNLEKILPILDLFCWPFMQEREQSVYKHASLLFIVVFNATQH